MTATEEFFVAVFIFSLESRDVVSCGVIGVKPLDIKPFKKKAVAFVLHAFGVDGKAKKDRILIKRLQKRKMYDKIKI